METTPIIIHCESEQRGRMFGCTISAVYKSETGAYVVDRMIRIQMNRIEIKILTEYDAFYGCE